MFFKFFISNAAHKEKCEWLASILGISGKMTICIKISVTDHEFPRWVYNVLWYIKVLNINIDIPYILYLKQPLHKHHIHVCIYIY